MYVSFLGIEERLTEYISLQANVVLIMTCSIREGAETKIWKRLNYLKSLKKLKKRKKENFQICILGDNI